MRNEAEELTKQLKKRFWGLDARTLYGIHYDDDADIFFDIHRVLRYQFYKDRGDTSKAFVDSENPTSPIGSEPLAVIRRTDVSSDEIMKDMDRLYSDIDKTINGIISARLEGNDVEIANVQHKMESLMVAVQQELTVIADFLRQ